MNNLVLRFCSYLLSLLLLMAVSGCSTIVSNAKQEFSDDLAATILSYDDPETIKKAVPSYLILISSLLRSDPENAELLKSGAQLYGAYASAFTDTPESKLALSRRAFSYALRAMCLQNAGFCDARDMPFASYKLLVENVEPSQVGYLYVFATTWAGLIEANSDDWNAVANLPRVRLAIERVLELDESIHDGNAHVYMAVLESLLPPAMGGKPEVAKQHYERAIEISHGHNLMARVMYADKYAKLMFDRQLHDRLLQEVLDAEVGSGDQVLVNTIAKQKAAELLQQADEYF